MAHFNLLKNKYFLYATEFFSGMSVMAVELGASRLLAPYFSSSQVIWTIIIGTIMIAMALGNIWGGRVADKNPDPARLYKRLLFAAVWIAAIPFLGKYLIAGISLAVALITEKNFLVIASFLSCLIIFVFPLMLLGTVTPSLVKYTVEDLDNNGEIVGKLGALNTIGSILGTFLPTFVTIPTVGTAATFIIFAVLLALLSLLYFLSSGRKLVTCVISFLLIGLFSISSVKYSFAFWENDLVYEGESIYNYLQVKEDEKSVILSTNVLAGVQSIKMKNQDFTGMYYDYALAAPYMAGAGLEPGSDILILGLGTGTFASMCTSYLDSPVIEGVEIDEKIARLSSQYFDLPESVKVNVADGRVYLSNSDKYDVIMVDAYQDITIPFQMSTTEFFSMVKAHLKEDGVMVVNMNMHSSKEGSINNYLCDTIASVFPYAYTAKVGSGTNMELFASNNSEMLSVFSGQIQAIESPDLQDMMLKVQDGLKPVEKGRLILTDDKAPVEVLGMRVIDEIIGDELHYYKTLIKEEGLEGLDFH